MYEPVKGLKVKGRGRSHCKAAGGPSRELVRIWEN